MQQYSHFCFIRGTDTDSISPSSIFRARQNKNHTKDVEKCLSRVVLSVFLFKLQLWSISTGQNKVSVTRRVLNRPVSCSPDPTVTSTIHKRLNGQAQCSSCRFSDPLSQTKSQQHHLSITQCKMLKQEPQFTQLNVCLLNESGRHRSENIPLLSGGNSFYQIHLKI